MTLPKYVISLPTREEAGVRIARVARCAHKQAECVDSWNEHEHSAYSNRDVAIRMYRYECPDCGKTWDEEE